MSTQRTLLTERMNEGPVPPGRGPAKESFYDFAKVLERLWIFYQAMEHGTPVVNSDEILSQLRVTVRRISTLQSGGGSQAVCPASAGVAKPRPDLAEHNSRA